MIFQNIVGVYWRTIFGLYQKSTVGLTMCPQIFPPPGLQGNKVRLGALTYALLKCSKGFFFQIATDFVENVLNVHNHFGSLISDVFQGDQAFKGAMDKAMTSVINHRQPKVQSKSPELVTDLNATHFSSSRAFLYLSFTSIRSWPDIVIPCSRSHRRESLRMRLMTSSSILSRSSNTQMTKTFFRSFTLEISVRIRPF